MRTNGVLFFLILLITLSLTFDFVSAYNISKAHGLGQRFDGIGALSAGASSALIGYNTTGYSQLMDYLFLPGFGASLHILKVEIGGDTQSTDGTEASHMHSADDENYYRGYEWGLMVEAKRRNPNIILFGLSWGFPGWVGEGKTSPWTNSTVIYTVKWILGAKKYYNLDIDYIGIWNEKGWDKGYTLALKAAIMTSGLRTKIVGHDATNWNVCDDLSKDAEWAAAVDVIGAHYPGSAISADCLNLNKLKWSSEDMSVSWNGGAQCWARALTENYVRANLTATIAWALIDSFYDNLPCTGTGLMRAVEPWSGFYEIGQVLWTVAHWGQFTAAGWFFLEHGQGVGLLDHGGSYVSLTDQSGEQLTIILETMAHDSSQCGARSVNYNITEQTASFQLDSSFAHVTQLFVFFSDLTARDTNQSFIYKGLINLDNRSFTLQLPVGVVYTLSTINGTKGAYEIPPSMPFPVPYHDDFDKYSAASEAAYFSDQTGSFEIFDTSGSRGRVMRQMATERPIIWCGDAPYPFSVIGDARWQQPLNISVDVMIEDVGVAFVAIGVAQGGWNVHPNGSPGIVFSLNTTNNGMWQLTSSTAILNPLSSGNTPITPGSWYTLLLSVLADHSEAYINGQLVGRCLLNATSSRGWAAIGSSWNHAQFDNFHLY